jgi:pyruvate/2-oxoglutarate dehydrogenase complex dihydrolipoamide dehydrogenase (E3) component/uncharacterized membrane protein YdjX (TVP38/TMEM64 family)
MNAVRLLVIVAVLAALIAFFALDLDRYLSLEFFQTQRDAIDAAVSAQPIRAGLLFFSIYVLVTGLSLPGASLLTLAAGAVFGLFWGVVMVSFASTLGATLAFLSARFLLRDWVQQRFGPRLRPINEGMARDGAFYLFALRLVPIFPFFAINLLMGLTPIRVWTFYWVSQLGMLAATIVFVYAGTQLGEFRVSPGLLGAFVLIGVFPLLARKLIDALRARKVYARWPRPARFDRNLIVIGGGAGGLVSAYIASAVKAKVTLIEAHKMGGDCLNYGCVPSKALIRSAKAAKQLQQAHQFGLRDVQGRVDFAAVMCRIREVIQAIEPHDSVERYTALGVEVLEGHARITSPWTVEVRYADGKVQVLTTRSIVIAAGATPVIPLIPGLEQVACLTSDTVWRLTALPPRVLVLGGGPIGCELAQSFARLGSQVTQVERAPRLLMREDPEVSEQVAASLAADGVRVLTSHLARRVEVREGRKSLIVSHGEAEQAIEFDELLCAVGRSPRVTGYGLEPLGIPLTERKTIETNAYLQTLYPNIYAVGDVAGPYPFTHTAAHEAWYAAVNALFGHIRKFKADYSVIPWATFTDPEVARVGLSETEAREQGIPFEVTRYGIDDLDRAIADGTAHGFVKVLTVPGRDRILGVTIVGEHAGDLLAEYVLAMKHGLGLNKILGTIHTYPTMSEANKYAAGEWKRAHAPKRLLVWVERFHAWMRG